MEDMTETEWRKMKDCMVSHEFSWHYGYDGEPGECFTAWDSEGIPEQQWRDR